MVADLLENAAKNQPDKAFAVFPRSQWTYRQTAERTWSTAHALRDLGVRQDDFVASWLPNGPSALRTWFGANALGATFAPLNPAYKGSILEHTINYTGATVLIAHADLVGRLEGLDLPALRHVVVFGALGEAPRLPVEFVSASRLDQGAASRPETERAIEGWDNLALIYTSGTTGPSKGVLCSYIHHHNYTNNTVPGADETDRFFACLPFFHVGGTVPLYGMLQRGGSVAITDGFHSDTFLEDVRKFGVTRAAMVGTMADFLMNRPAQESDKDHSLRQAILVPMIRNASEFRERFGIDIFTAYGSTEQTSHIMSEIDAENYQSCGKQSSPDCELRLVDKYDRAVPTGEAGELIVRHTRPWTLTVGYNRMPGATAELWRNGWLHTGDILRRDEEGYYYFLDRKSDSLRRRGENISSAEVEKELMAHPEVALAAVVAAPAAEAEDEVQAFVVRNTGSTLSAEQLVTWLVPRTGELHGAALRRLLGRAAAHRVPEGTEVQAAPTRGHGCHLGPGGCGAPAPARNPDPDLVLL